MDQDSELQNLKEKWAYQGLWDKAKPYVHLQKLDMVEPDLQNLITWNGAKDLYGKAKGTGLFQNLE